MGAHEQFGLPLQPLGIQFGSIGGKYWEMQAKAAAGLITANWHLHTMIPSVLTADSAFLRFWK